METANKMVQMIMQEVKFKGMKEIGEVQFLLDQRLNKARG